MLIHKLRAILSSQSIAKQMEHTEAYTRQLIAWSKWLNLSLDIQYEVAKDVKQVVDTFINNYELWHPTS